MCGIAGYFGPKEIPHERRAACLALMRRRGPDHAAERHFLNQAGRNVYLLHARLSIIDLDPRANGPFRSGSRCIVYNGELYNYVELREELRRLGRSFSTSSDTEVLVAALAQWGDAAFDRFEGMWAFAAYDEKDGTLLLSRDRFGEKPLYLYTEPDGGLYFGSEAKFIAALAGARLKVNEDQIARFLVNGYKSLYKGRHTFFTGVSEQPAGTSTTYSAAGQAESPRRYWTPAYRPDEAMTYEQAVAGARERLIRSVELRLRADVPLAFCMSGGVDSNALISIAKNVFKYDVHGFTIANDDKRYEEKAIVDEAVRRQNLRHTWVAPSAQDFLPRLRELVRYHDAPVYTITYYVHWLLMQSVAERGYRISVSGTSADELFTGYYDHHLAYLYEVRAEPALLAASREAWSRHVRPVVRNPFLGNPDAFIADPGFREHIFLHADEFAACLKKPWREPFAEERYTSSLLRNRMLNELFHEATPVVLHEDDLNAMYYSIENRSPFLDRRLFEFCYTIPSRHLIRDGRAKAVLREAVRGIAPDAVVDNRRKVGFNAPIFSLLDAADPAVRAELLKDGPIFERLKREKIEALLGREFLPNSESKFLFNFLTIKLFLEEFA